jgi:hypothetical protein
MDAFAEGSRDSSIGHRRRREVSRFLLLAGALILPLAGVGCRGAGETTDLMVPRSWRGNPWGPEANAARARGDLPVIPFNDDMVAWERWGRHYLRDGDILFRMGDARAALGLFPFSKISAGIAASRFSHSGIVAMEGGEPVVYDTTTTGPQRQPFSVWLLDTRGCFGIKRPRPEYQTLAPKAVAFCRAVYHAQTPFDFDMQMGDERLYCIELTERAYREAGLPLSHPIRLDHLPRYDEHPWSVRLMKLFTQMVPHQLAYVIGNDTIGIWSSPSLELVYEAPDARSPGSPRPGPPAPSPQTLQVRPDR